MAKGDHKRVENATEYQGNLAQNRLDNLRTDITRQNQELEGRYNTAANQNMADYGALMNNYRQLIEGGPASNQNFGAYGGYQNFADTGGYSPQDIQDIRARAIAPTRAVYANANADIDRQRSLQGGYSPNYTAAKAKMAREMAYGISDANVNANASIADSIRQGKLAGLGGMTNIDTAKMSEALQNRGLQNQTMSGATSLYGQTPGLTSTIGNQMLTSSGQRVNTEQLQLGLMENIIRSLLGMSSVPGNYQSALGNIGSTINLGGQIASGLSGIDWGKIFGRGGNVDIGGG